MVMRWECFLAGKNLAKWNRFTIEGNPHFGPKIPETSLKSHFPVAYYSPVAT
jgi:hypothetical protein